MGTRNLTCVYLNGEYKVAQYGQWDGYPSGQGATALNFLRSVDMGVFRVRVSKVTFYTDEEIEELDKNGKFPVYLGRDTGAEILNVVMKEDNLKLVNSVKFAEKSLFCEWAYVIDLDKNRFEIYKGFVKKGEPRSTEERFSVSDPDESKYDAVKLAKFYGLDNLPTVEEMVELFDLASEAEDEEE